MVLVGAYGWLFAVDGHGFALPVDDIVDGGAEGFGRAETADVAASRPIEAGGVLMAAPERLGGVGLEAGDGADGIGEVIGDQVDMGGADVGGDEFPVAGLGDLLNGLEDEFGVYAGEVLAGLAHRLFDVIFEGGRGREVAIVALVRSLGIAGEVRPVGSEGQQVGHVD